VRRLGPVALIALLAALALGLLVAHDRRTPAKPLIHATTDFSTFYCAGAVVRARANPYRVEPLRACQRAIGESPLQPDWYVVPAPFPGYMLALFAGLSLLPAYAAHLLWLFAIFAAVGFATWALARITAFSPLLIGLLLATPLAFYDVGFSEPTPFFVALLAWAAERAQRGAWRACGVLTALAMLEPHLGLPAFVAVLLFAPRARAALLGTAAALAAISLIAIGIPENVEYFARALPAHAASELTFRAQFSLSRLLAALGVVPRVALAAGSLTFVLATAAGVWAGRRVALHEHMPAALLLVPPAVGMLGGTYLHENHVVTALSAALLLARARTVPAPLAVAPLALMSVFWVADSAWKALVAASTLSALAGFALVGRALRGSRAVRLAWAGGYALAAVVLFAALQTVPRAPGGGDVVAPAPPVAADAEASEIWAYRNTLPPVSLADPRFEAAKIPYVLALALILGCAAASRATARRRESGDARAGLEPSPA
jgi:hypothetical protein